MNREALFAAVTASWDAETSASKEWTDENRPLGQCAVTACILQDYLGGDILNTIATLPDSSADSHYYNVIEGEEVDLTRPQFPEGTRFTPGVPKRKEFNSTRDYILSYGLSKDRYDILKARVASRLL